MKQLYIGLIITMGSSLSMAGTFQTDEFNRMMQENQKIEQDLRSHLQKEAGIDLSERPGHIPKEKLMGTDSIEQVVVNSKIHFWKQDRTPSQKQNSNEEMTRISQELDEALNN